MLHQGIRSGDIGVAGQGLVVATLRAIGVRHHIGCAIVQGDGVAAVVQAESAAAGGLHRGVAEAAGGCAAAEDHYGTLVGDDRGRREGVAEAKAIGQGPAGNIHGGAGDVD